MISKELLEELYVKQGLKQREIADKLNISQTKVCYLCKKYGIYKDKNREKIKNHNKHWTDEEIKILIDNYGKYSFKTIGKMMGKTAKAVENKKNRLKLGDSLKYTEYITAKELAKALGRSHTTIRRWINKNGLPATYKTLIYSQKFYRIKVSKFWSWARLNLNLMKWELYERGLLGKEPMWLDSEIKKYNKKSKINCKKWTKTDICYLISYYKNGLSLSEISEKLNRTKAAIDKRLRILEIPKRNVNVPWREEETEILKQMRSEGKTLKEISEELGRAISIVSGKCQLYHVKKRKINI